MNLTGITPSNFGSGFDNASVPNVTFYYTGQTVVHGNGMTVSIPGFQIMSIYNLTKQGTFTSQATKDTGAQNGVTDQTIGAVTVPLAPGGTVPEPAALLLAGAGLAALVAVRRFL